MFKRKDFGLPKRLIEDVASIIEDDNSGKFVYHIYNSKTNQRVGRSHKTLNSAIKAKDKHDSEYGSAVHVHKRVPISEDTLDEISHDTLNRYQAKATQSFSKDRFSSDPKKAAKAVKHGEGAGKAIKKMYDKNPPDISKDDRGYGKGRYMGDSVEITDKIIEASGTMNAQVAPADDSKPIDTSRIKKKKITEFYLKQEDIGGAGSSSDGDVDDLDDYLDTDYNDFDPLENSNDVEDDSLDEMIQEVLSKDAKAGDWIHDFVHSKNPKFAGKSKKERQRMALGAYYAKQNESILNKFANKVMGAAPEKPKYKVGQTVSYETYPHQKDWKDGGRGKGKITDYKNGHYMINGNPVNHFEIKKVHNEERTPEQKKKDELWAAAKKRVEGRNKDENSGEERSGKARAGEYSWGQRKEEIENLSELKKSTLGSYIRKASTDAKMHGYDSGWSDADTSSDFRNKKRAQDSENKAQKRIVGIDKATKRLEKEEIEHLEELKKDTVKSYLDKKLDKMDKNKEDFSKHNKDQQGLIRATKRILRKSPVSEGILKQVKRHILAKDVKSRMNQELDKAVNAKDDSEHKKHSNRMMRFHSLMKKEDKDPHMDAGCGTVQPFVQNENPSSNPVVKKKK